MKTLLKILICFSMLPFCNNLRSAEAKNEITPTENGIIRVMCTPEMYELTTKWANEFASANPVYKIEVIVTEYNTFTTDVTESIGITTEKSLPNVMPGKFWNLVAAREIMVPIMNVKSPYFAEIQRNGLNAMQFNRIFEYVNNSKNGFLEMNSKKVPVNIYVADNESVKLGLSRFLSASDFTSIRIKYMKTEEVITAIQKDPIGIGFANAADILGFESQQLPAGICLLPIDKNSNGKLDATENIYRNGSDFTHGVWLGKFPNVLITNVYVVGNGQVSDEKELAFISWILTDGQTKLNNSGYMALAAGENQSHLAMFQPITKDQPIETNNYASGLILALFVVIAFGVLTTALLKAFGSSKQTLDEDIIAPAFSFDENSLNMPKGLFFDKTHTWAFMEQDGKVKVGLDDFLQHVTGLITRVEMKNPGTEVRKGEILFSIIQNGKQLNISSPISGKITEKNSDLIANSSMMNSSPYVKGWVYKIEPDHWLSDIKQLNMPETNQKWLRNEFSRLKDFIAGALNLSSPQFEQIVLQEGGTLKDNVLADFGPEAWEDFQTKFLDMNK